MSLKSIFRFLNVIGKVKNKDKALQKDIEDLYIFQKVFSNHKYRK